jgi:hypothetical protein
MRRKTCESGAISWLTLQQTNLLAEFKRRAGASVRPDKDQEACRSCEEPYAKSDTTTLYAAALGFLQCGFAYHHRVDSFIEASPGRQFASGPTMIHPAKRGPACV